MFGDQIIQFFDGFGAAGMLLALFVIFIIDSMLFPMVPELFLLIMYAANPSPWWGVLLIAVALLAIGTGNTLLYITVKKLGVPPFIEKVMKKYSALLIARDETMLLINRIAPVLPYTGAFIAINEWRYDKSMTYILLGGCAKFSVLVMLSGMFYSWFERGTAQNATFILILLTLALGVVLAYVRKRKMDGEGIE